MLASKYKMEDLFGLKPEVKKKDWKGNANSVFKTLASSHHTTDIRQENDYYATDPKAVEMLLQLETFSHCIWEPSCGQGHMSEVLKQGERIVRSSDLIDRGYGISGVDFLKETETWDGDIITNPPYSFAKEFIYKALELIPDGRKVAMFLKVQFMEGKGRKELFVKHPPKTIYISSSRINCAKNGNFTGLRESGGSAVAYAWYVWNKGFNGTTEVKWFN